MTNPSDRSIAGEFWAGFCDTFSIAWLIVKAPFKAAAAIGERQ